MNKCVVGYVDNLGEEVLKNSNYRKVVFSGINSQLVLMSLLPEEEIGLETHNEHDQFFYIVSGKGIVTIGDEEFEVEAEDAALVPAGVEHNVINTSQNEELKLYTIYSPPEHPDGTIHESKDDSM